MCRTNAIRACVVATASLLTLASCSSPSGPAVSFRADVLPIFRLSCAVSGANCHGDPGVTQSGRPYLGSMDGGVDAETIIEQIVGKKSAEDPSMALVAPGDAANSFLMHKMDGDQDTLTQECATSAYSAAYPHCGQMMPPTSAMPLPGATRDTVRAWIEQGAKSN
jgi:hypothetical protein